MAGVAVQLPLITHSWHPKLDQEKADEMRRLHAKGLSRQALAARFGVSKTSVQEVLAGKRFGVGRKGLDPKTLKRLRERSKVAQRKFRAKNHQKARAYRRAYYHENLEASRQYNRSYCKQADRLRHYGLSPEQFDEMVKAQGGRCAICDSAPEHKQLCVDHDHSSNQVRGLLCDFCNTALGLMADDPLRLAAAVRYLRKFTRKD